jgi:hypothetical protein
MAINFYFAAVTRIRGQGSALVETRRPQPTVKTNGSFRGYLLF